MRWWASGWPHAGAVAEPGGGGLGRDALVGAGGAAAVDPGQFAEPVAVQPVDEPAQDQDPLGGLRVGEGVEVFGGELVDRGGQQA